ncbi:MAG: uroporphyrinogen decarboxylase family protein [bacterium]
MNGRERALKALRREPVDRTPIYSHFRNPRAIEIITGMDFLADPFAATAAAYRILEIDMTKEIMIPASNPPDGFRINPTGYGFMRERPITNNSDEFIEFVKTLPDYDGLKIDYDFDGEIKKLIEWFDHQRYAVGDSTLITGRIGGCFDPCLEMFGYETFLTALLLEPSAAEAAIRHFASKRRLEAEIFVAAGCSEVVWYNDDIAGLNGTIAPHDILRKFWLPNMRFGVEPLMNAGIFVTYHSDGDIRAILPDIAESGFKGLHPLEPKAHMDPVELKQKWVDRFVLFGGLCQVSVLPYGTEEEVRSEVRRLLDGTAHGGGYFIGSSGMTGPDIPPENAIAWIEEAREYGRKFGGE